jgi:hypothetical protein
MQTMNTTPSSAFLSAVGNKIFPVYTTKDSRGKAPLILFLGTRWAWSEAGSGRLIPGKKTGTR